MNKNLDLDLQTILIQNERLFREVEEVRKMLLEKPNEKKGMDKEFYTIEECWRLKGGCSLNTLKANPFLRVGCGNPKYSHYIGGRLCYKKQDVMKWLSIEDGTEFLEYAKDCGITVIPEKYLRLAQKAQEKDEVAI